MKKIMIGVTGIVVTLCIVMMTIQTNRRNAFTENMVSLASGEAIKATESVITLPTKEVVKLSWKSKKSSVKAGKKIVFKVNNNGKTVSSSDVTWTVSKKKCASISKKGVLKGKQIGKVKVTASYKGESISCNVKIKPKKIIGLDAGHQSQGNNGTEPVGPGATTYKVKVAGGTRGASSGVPEYKFTLTMAKKIRAKLIKKGYKVVMTRTKNNVNISNKERAVKINESGADICIRLHGDGGAASARGASALYPSKNNRYVGYLSDKSYKLSKCVLGAYCASTGIRSRGCVKRDDLTGTNWSTVPVTLIEFGFMTNASEDSYMQSKEGQEAMADGVVKGIEKYFK
ncbi:MAG: N-acetylmuramoyl-L-alanine amidase [Lachnospiraceae bacterium]|jgi:N-acetylmuramoyl-L-alanine amidase|nr:N-acetylmuramoyl-L-alanine amidase [Lachnospiraceae bacterium]